MAEKAFATKPLPQPTDAALTLFAAIGFVILDMQLHDCRTDRAIATSATTPEFSGRHF